jgi:hypothetical protein
MSYLRKSSDWLLELIRTFYPFAVCWIGPLVLAAGYNDLTHGAELWVIAVSGFSFIWAIDLAYARGKAKGESQTAARIAALLTTGSNTEISIDINHNDTRRCDMNVTSKGGEA